MELPDPVELMADGNPLPYVLVGDEAFQLSHFLLRPYPGRGLVSDDRRIYNYRLSRARRVIENAFGILVSRRRILKKPFEFCIDTTIEFIKVLVCLHNWLRDSTERHAYMPAVIELDSLTNELENLVLKDSRLGSIRNCKKKAMEMRDEFCAYFNQEGAVNWQYDID